uniref:Uncharacterized protein n=1 Tax=Plectus sambesii TaxID=2011161 RepID=A0A914VGG0_9BILA
MRCCGVHAVTTSAAANTPITRWLVASDREAQTTTKTGIDVGKRRRPRPNKVAPYVPTDRLARIRAHRDASLSEFRKLSCPGAGVPLLSDPFTSLNWAKPCMTDQ